MGSIEPLAIASAVPMGVLPLGSTLLWAPLLLTLGIAAIGILLAVPRRPRPLRMLRLVHSTAS